jgi:acyl carrier protein
MTINPASNQTEFEAELAQLVTAALNLDMSPAEIDPVAPLFGDAGLGLDSIDILEISLAVSKHYGIQLRSDDENSKQIFASLRSLGAYIQQRRTK